MATTMWMEEESELWDDDKERRRRRPCSGANFTQGEYVCSAQTWSTWGTNFLCELKNFFFPSSNFAFSPRLFVLRVSVRSGHQSRKQ